MTAGKMLSNRGQFYAASDLYGEYGRQAWEPYDKISNPKGEIMFLNAENFPMHGELVKYINTHFTFITSNMSFNEGQVGTTRLRNAMASHINDYFSPFTPVTIDHVTFTPEMTGLNEIFTYNLTDEGEAILLGRPTYGIFHADLVNNSKCKLIYATFGDVDQFSINCIERYEDALKEAEKHGIKVKAFLICNPHNPLGRCYPKETLRALMEFCEVRGIHLISDEVYALSVFEVEGSKSEKFTSVLSIDPRGLARTDKVHVLYGLSKNFSAAGLRLGCLISQNKEMTKATRAISRFHWPSEVSGAIATTMLEDKDFVASYIGRSRERLAEGYSFATKILKEVGIDYVHNSNAGFFLWLDLSTYLSVSSLDDEGWNNEKELQARLSDAGVQRSTGFGHKAERPGWFRLIFTLEREFLEEGIRRLLVVVKQNKGS